METPAPGFEPTTFRPMVSACSWFPSLRYFSLRYPTQWALSSCQDPWHTPIGVVASWQIDTRSIHSQGLYVKREQACTVSLITPRYQGRLPIEQLWSLDHSQLALCTYLKLSCCELHIGLTAQQQSYRLNIKRFKIQIPPEDWLFQVFDCAVHYSKQQVFLGALRSKNECVENQTRAAG